jgi:predicted transposase YbfD/YdcC
MNAPISEEFKGCFSKLADSRIDRKKLYPLPEILFIVLCGSICGAGSWRDFVLFGQEKLDFLREHFPYSHGIPSKNTFARVFAALKAEEFRACFIDWVQGLQKMLAGVVAIDGKTLCNSHDDGLGKSAIHMVSAFATGVRLVLAQEKVEEKSNEITAIPKLLKLFDVRGNTITIDAAGCQKAIAEQIVEQQGDYVLALKGNQGTLNEDVRLFLETEIAKPLSSAIESVYEESDAGHGRIETRKCIVSSQIDWLAQKSQWAGLRTIAMIEETREIGEKTSFERRFFISSLPADASKIAQAVRAHWMVENNLHWTLDVVFNEDQSRIRKDHAPENMAIIRHFTLNMLHNAQASFKGVGIKGLRKKAGWGNDTLRTVLKQNF